MVDKHTVSVFLKRKNKILILRRSEKVATYRRKWGVIHGRLRFGEDPKKRALIEINEETGIKNAKLIKKGRMHMRNDKDLNTKWHIHPFLFEIDSNKIRLNWENSDFRWIEPNELKGIDAIPKLDKDYKMLV